MELLIYMDLVLKPSVRRQFGIYYTPPELTESVCAWAVRAPADRVLEPSFGGCVFLDHAARVLRARGAARPYAHLYGCDSDQAAFGYLRRLFPERDYARRFVKEDFLKIDPSSATFPKVDAVVGNPPYVSNHNMLARQRKTARASNDRGLLHVPATASLWAHFINHSLHFLREGGRVGMVLPQSAFKVDYGRELLKQLAERFAAVHLISLGERVFRDTGAREATTVLLCNGWSNSLSRPPAPREIRVQTLTELRSLLPNLVNCQRVELKIACEAAPQRVTFQIAKYYEQRKFIRLGDIADIRIGIVTGANRYFVLSAKSAEKNNLPKTAFIPILARMAMAPGAALSKQDLFKARVRKDRCLLLDTHQHEHNIVVKRYLRKFAANKRIANRTFGKRPIWHQPILGTAPDAFLSYMNTRAPRLVINIAKAQCLNNIHRLYIKRPATRKSLKLAAISMWSTIGQLSAELIGRSYGDGVLKIEPSEARLLPLLAPSLISNKILEEYFRKLDVLARSDQFEKARHLADNLYCSIFPDLRTSKLLADAEKWLKSLRAHRGLGS